MNIIRYSLVVSHEEESLKSDEDRDNDDNEWDIASDMVLGLDSFPTTLDKAYANLSKVQNIPIYDRIVRARIAGAQSQSNH